MSDLIFIPGLGGIRHIVGKVQQGDSVPVMQSKMQSHLCLVGMTLGSVFRSL